MKHTNKKGFTIVELVIVIAVIAILAAVLIPTFTNLIKKANLSADQQAVRQMNTILAAEGAVKKNNIFEVYDALAESGFNAENYKPLTKGTQFVWDAELDRVLLVEGNTVLYPADYKDLNGAERTWKDLSAENALTLTKPENFSAESTSVVVNTAEEYAYVVNEFNKDATKDGLIIDLNGKVIDMKGSNMTLANKANGKVTKDITLKNGTIKNIVNIDAAYAGTGGGGNDKFYTCGALFGTIDAGAVVVVENITIEDVSIRNTNVGNAGIIAASINTTSSLTLNNVTIKNSTVIAHRNAGALVGFINASPNNQLAINGVTMENVSVLTVGGRSGLLVGYIEGNTDKITATGIVLTNCKYDIYTCAQNTGTGLGLNGTTLTSYVNKSDGTIESEGRQYHAGAYATYKQNNDNKQAKYTGFDAAVTVQ